MTNAPENEPDSRADRFNIRFIALGVFLIVLLLSLSEWLVWRLVSDDTSDFFKTAIARVSHGDVTKEEKDAIRQETFERLAIPSVLGLGVVVLLAPLGVGLLVGARSRSPFSSPIAVFLGVAITLAISQTFSVGALVAALLYAGLSFPGQMIAKKVQKWRKIN